MPEIEAEPLVDDLDAQRMDQVRGVRDLRDRPQEGGAERAAERATEPALRAREQDEVADRKRERIPIERQGERAEDQPLTVWTAALREHEDDVSHDQSRAGCAQRGEQRAPLQRAQGRARRLELGRTNESSRCCPKTTPTATAASSAMTATIIGVRQRGCTTWSRRTKNGNSA